MKTPKISSYFLKISASLHPSHKWAPPVHVATGGHSFLKATADFRLPTF